LLVQGKDGKIVRECRAGNQRVRERCQVSRWHAGKRGEGSRDIRVEAGEYSERAYFVLGDMFLLNVS
jgi:hypothetical protein